MLPSVVHDGTLALQHLPRRQNYTACLESVRRDYRETMDMDESQDQMLYRVVINQEEQYSIWPADIGTVPPGWRVIGEPRSKQECLDYIEKNWTDMRPASVRRRMESGD